MDNLFFLSGLPRSGNTLLGSIINQNPDLCITAKSPVLYILEKLHKQLQEEQEFHLANFPDYTSFDNAIRGAVAGYYKDWPASHIIDRAHWGNAFNIDLIRHYITPNPKFICLYRPLEEVVASFIKWGKDNANLIFTPDMTQEELYTRAIEEEGVVSEALCAFLNIISNVPTESILLLTYKDLVNNTKETIKKLYDFVGLPAYDHDLTKLQQFELNNVSYDDAQYLGKNLHTIDTSGIKRREYDLLDYLSEDQKRELEGTSSLIETLANARGLL